MGIIIFDFLVKGSIFLVYIITCLLSLIFMLSLETFLKIEEAINFEVFSSKIINPLLDSNIDCFSDWLIRHNKLIGLLMVIASIYDLSLCFLIS